MIQQRHIKETRTCYPVGTYSCGLASRRLCSVRPATPHHVSCDLGPAGTRVDTACAVKVVLSRKQLVPAALAGAHECIVDSPSRRGLAAATRCLSKNGICIELAHEQHVRDDALCRAVATDGSSVGCSTVAMRIGRCSKTPVVNVAIIRQFERPAEYRGFGYRRH